MQTELEVEGVPSAHDPNRRFYPHMEDGHWVCDCEHYRIYHTPCRHIFEKRFNNLQELYEHICETVKDNRDLRDMACQDFDEVITYVGVFREYEMNLLSTLMMNIAVYHGTVCTDDLHIATNERYRGDKIVGVVTGALLRDGLIGCVGRKKTERRIAHGRSIGVYQLTEKGYKTLQARRPERALEVRQVPNNNKELEELIKIMETMKDMEEMEQHMMWEAQ